MDASTNSRKQYLLEEIFGLAVACPFDQGNPCGCPLHELRKKSLQERYRWLRDLSDDKLREILIFHRKCLDEKEKSQTPEIAEQASVS
jgi:hypothetical protein